LTATFRDSKVVSVPAGQIQRHDRVADERERVADERDSAADERDSAADERDSAADAREGQTAADELSHAQDDEVSAVAAHGLLNSAAVVSMGIETLAMHWQGMGGDDRLRLLRRMQAHATSMDVGLRDVIQGRTRVVAAVSDSS
jgi:hypothetical protein